MERRQFLTRAAAGAGLLIAPTDAVPESSPNSPTTTGARFDVWSALMDQKFANLTKEQGHRLLAANGANSFDELKLQWLKRYPTTKPSRDFANNLLLDIDISNAAYERSVTHDKESHNRGTNYDKEAHSRNYDTTDDFKSGSPVEEFRNQEFKEFNKQLINPAKPGY